jgi:Haem-binding domain
MKTGKKILNLKNILIVIIALLVLIQFFGIDKTNPTINPESDFMSIENPPAEYSQIIKTACYDCHSNETVYPWYADIAPVSWILQSHINEAREHINFSEWESFPAGRRGHFKEECAEEILSGDMPLKSYTLIHKNARMDEEARKNLAEWLNQ